jgi:hypothetical protein
MVIKQQHIKSTKSSRSNENPKPGTLNLEPGTRNEYIKTYRIFSIL